MDLDKVTLEKVVDPTHKDGGFYVINKGIDCLALIGFKEENAEEVAKQKAREFRDGKLKVVRTEVEF